MAGLNIGDVVSIQIHGRIFNQVTMSTFFYKVTTAATTPDTKVALEALGTAFKTQLNAPGLAFVQAAPQNWVAEKVRLQVVSPYLSQYAIVNWNMFGTVGSDANASNVTGTLTRRTSLGGRNQIGALHTAPLPDAAMLNGLIAASHIARLENLADKMDNNFTVLAETTQVTPVLWSHTDPFDDTKLITSIIVQPEIRVLRRRTVGLGI
jgi:hypothetical protein